MKLADLLYKDPADRFNEIAHVGASGPVEAENDAVSPTAIEAVIAHERQAGGTPGDIVKAVGKHVALNTSLTEPAAQPLVAAAMSGVSNGDSATSDSAAAKAVSSAVAKAGFSGQVNLSDPVMLGPLPRLGAAVLLGVIAILSVVFDANLPAATGWGAYVALTVAGVLSILGVLVLVMGYKNVTISGSSTPSSS